MSLRPEALRNAINKCKKMQNRVNNLFAESEQYKNLKDKVQMDHWGFLYLFGKKIDANSTDNQILEIIEETPVEEYDGITTFFGRWCIRFCPAVTGTCKRTHNR